MSLDLTKGHMPLLAALALATFVAATAFSIGQWLGSITNVQSEVAQLNGDMAEVKRSVSSIEQIVGQMRYGQWTRGDQTLFCWEAERANPKWRCPAVKTDRANFEGLPPDELRAQQ